jgi:hypothetical protein
MRLVMMNNLFIYVSDCLETLPAPRLRRRMFHA